MQNRDAILKRMLNPRSIAIIGASMDLDKINGRPLRNLLEKGYGGKIYPVNPKYQDIAGLRCYPSVELLPEAPDLAIVAVPAKAVLASIEALGQRGGRAAVIFSSGFGELGAEGKQAEQALARRAGELGVALCGPNCLGFINALDRVCATFSQYADGETSSGSIAFVTQSGAFGTAIAALAKQRGLGLGYFINTGNQADLTASELMLAVVEDPRVRVMAGYLEGVTDGNVLVRLAKRCRALGKPLVLTKVGRKASGIRAAASHTGALAVEDTVFDAIIRQHGVLRARNEEQMLDMLEALSQSRSAQGNGLGIITQSGGAAVMMADRAEEVDLTVPVLTSATQARLGEVMPAFGAAGNPVDVTGQFVAQPELLRESVIAVMEDPNIHVGIVWLQLMTAHVDVLVGIFKEIQEQVQKPFFVCWVAAPQRAREALQALGIPVFGAGERAVDAAGALARFHAYQTSAQGRQAVPPVPVADFSRYAVDGPQETTAAVEWLKEIGVPMAAAWLADTEDRAVDLWRRAAGPVALKIESPDITHKTEVGGVVLNLDDEAAIRSAYQSLRQRAIQALPGAHLKGVLVQAMSTGHLELVIGAQRDPAFGMVIMVGIGGVFVEVLKDVAFRQAPFDVAEGLDMLAELRATALLDGVRGKAGVDRRKIARVLSDVSAWAAGMEPVLAELDLNPVLVNEDGPVVVDCLMIFDRIGL